MARYRLNEETGVVHDILSSCDDAKRVGLTPLTYTDFRAALRGDLLTEGKRWAFADPCDHCFRDDELEPSG